MKKAYGDDRSPDTGLLTTTAPDGTIIGQRLYANEFFVFNPMFFPVSEAEKNTLETFYATNKTIAFDFAYSHAGMTTENYECNFISPGIRCLPEDNGNWRCWAFFRGKEV